MEEKSGKTRLKLILQLAMIICLTNIPALVCLPLFFRESIGYILGSVGSLISMLWLAWDLHLSLSRNIGKTGLGTVKGYYARTGFLIVYALVMVRWVKPDILTFGVGLLSFQMAVVIRQVVTLMKNSTYFRSTDG